MFNKFCLTPFKRWKPRLCIKYDRLQRRYSKVTTILYDSSFIYITVKSLYFKKIVWNVILSMSHITFIFLTRFYYKINFITLSQTVIKSFLSYLRKVFTHFVRRTIYCSTQKMHVSEYVCKICPKELDIFLGFFGPPP